ncbi:GNAT family N-acetyltransferase [Paenibacillus sp. CAA11]|uniref:GNAT family N-acetyltransferase n=1 Tax=Paenibacillus sp. CAA11 TaxID=1532905 RepID=UPI000D3A4571|nr:GNAT family protein [Paenibacillus sp. CAA11]AWB45754.1 GNAT family N-acetyltransferase [Paenibacillus sp. CAA11]
MVDMQQEGAAKFLEGYKVYMRPIEAQEAELYLSLLNDNEVRRLTGTKPVFGQEATRSYLEAKRQDASEVLLWIVDKRTDEPVGDIQLMDVDHSNRSAGIRIAITTEHQGQGYGSEAMDILLDYAFGVLNLHRIELNVFDYNERARHVYKKLGFVEEGIQREALYYNHQYYDSVIMSILEDEYRLRKARKL